MAKNVNYKEFDSYKKVYQDICAILSDRNAEVNVYKDAKSASDECLANGIEMYDTDLLSEILYDAIDDIENLTGIEIKQVECHDYNVAYGDTIGMDILLYSAALRAVVKNYGQIVDEKIKPFYSIEKKGTRTLFVPAYRSEDLNVWMSLANELSDICHLIGISGHAYICTYDIAKHFMYSIIEDLLGENTKNKDSKVKFFIFDYFSNNSKYMATLPHGEECQWLLDHTGYEPEPDVEFNSIATAEAKAEKFTDGEDLVATESCKSDDKVQETIITDRRSGCRIDYCATEKAVFAELVTRCEELGIFVYRNACNNEVRDKAKMPYDYIFTTMRQETNENGHCSNFNRECVFAASELDGSQHNNPNSPFYKKNGKTQEELYDKQVEHDLTKQDWMNTNGIPFQRFINYGPRHIKRMADSIMLFVTCHIPCSAISLKVKTA